MIVAAVGCRKGTSADIIDDVLLAALAAHAITPTAVDALATVTSKSDETGIREVAYRRGLPMRLVSMSAMANVVDRVLTRSARVAELTGIPAVAEAAALVAAGRNSRLLGPRVANSSATCAIAIGDGP